MVGERAGVSEVVGAQRDAFAVPEEIAYFNTASISPQLHRVRAAGEAALEQRGRPWAISALDWFSDVERLRALFGQLIGADAEGVAVVPATSYGFAVAVRNLGLRAGDRVVVLAEEFPSGIYTWRATTTSVGTQIVTVSRLPGQSWTEAILDVLDERVCVVSVPNVHWTDGALIDLAAVSARSHEIGARLVIDGSQSIGAMPFDVATLRPDFVVTVGYKWLLGPVGVSYLYVAEEHREGEPIEQNWIARAGAEGFARLVDYRDAYQPGARRFDVGQRTQFELIPMAIAALEQLYAWQVPAVAAALAVLNQTIARQVSELGFDALPPERRAGHILGVRLPEALCSHIVAALAALNCFVAVRGPSLRIAPHLHVTDSDVQRLISALGMMVPCGATGGCSPQ